LPQIAWVGLVIFTFLPGNVSHFSQPSCESPLVFQNSDVFFLAPVRSHLSALALKRRSYYFFQLLFIIS
jgi:hypothetical protein